MEKLEKLWKVLVRDKYYNKSFEEFQVSFGKPEYQKKVFDVVTRDKLYTKPFESFIGTYVSTVKKKDESQPTSMDLEVPLVSQSNSEADQSSSVESSNDPNDLIDPIGGQGNQDQIIQAEQEQELESSLNSQEPVVNRIGFSDQTTDSYNNGGFFIDQDSTNEKNTYLEDALGKNSVTDFIGDIYRAGKSGFIQGNTADEGLELLYDGANATSEDIQDFLASQARLRANGQTDEMANFNNIYDNSSNKVSGFLQGMASNPSVIFQLLAETVTQMANTASLTAAGGVIATSAAGGAALGSIAGGVGAAPGAVLAAFNPVTLRAAFGAAGGALETGLSFAQFLEQEVKDAGEEMNEEGIAKVLNDPEALSRIRLKSLGRGGIIGTIDALAAGGGSMLIKSAAKSGVSVGKRKLLAAGADALGGGVGETAAILATEGAGALDVREIGFETFGGIGKTPLTYAITKYSGKVPEYTIKGRAVDSDLMAEAVYDSDDASFMGMNIDIKNDPDMKNDYDKRKMKLIAGNDIKQKLQEAGVTNEKIIDELVDLELEKNKFIGNDTEAGKQKLKEIKNKIAEISGLQEEQQLTEKEIKAEQEKIETDYANEYNAITEKYYYPSDKEEQKLKDEGKPYSVKEKEGVNTEEVDAEYKAAENKRQDRLNQLNEKTDAIQESSSEEVDAQEPPEDSPKVGAGDGIPIISPNEKGKKNPNKNKSTEEIVDDKKEKTIIQNERNYDIVRDKSGDVVSVNDKKGKPLKGKKLAAAEKQIIKDLDVDSGKKIKFSPSMTESDVSNEIADNSDNAREIAEAINLEESVSEDNKSESSQQQEIEERRVYRGNISEDDFAKYNDRNNLPKDKRGRTWKFINKPVKDALGRETDMGGEGFAKRIEDIADESGQTFDAVLEEYFDYILAEKEPKRSPRATLNALKDRFKNITGIRATKDNIKAILGKKKTDIKSEVNQKEAEVKAKEAEQVELQNEIEQNILDKLTKLDFSKGFKNIRDYLKTLRDSDKISFKQMASIMDVIEESSFSDEKSIQSTVNYVKEVLSAVSKKSEQSSLRKLAVNIRKNIKKLIGRMRAGKENSDAIYLEEQLLSLSNIDPNVVPDSVYDTYKSILQQIGKKTKALDSVEDASVIAVKVQEVLKAISEQEQDLPMLTQLFADFENKVLYKNGKINILDTINQMLKDDVISDEDAKLMKKYKKEISPRPDKVQQTAEEIAEEKEVLIKEVKNTGVDNNRIATASDKSFPSRLVRDSIAAFNKIIKNNSALQGMSNADLKLLLRSVDSINKGYFPAQLVERLTNRLNANKNISPVAKLFSKFKFLSVSKLTAKISSMINKNEDFALNALRRNTLFGIDQLLNNFKSLDLYNAIFKPMAKSHSSFKTANQQDANLREKAEKLLSKAFNKNGNNIVKSKIKQMMYRIQLEYNSNPELQGKTLKPLADWLDASIKDYESGTTNQDKRTIDVLKELREEYVADGQLDIDKLYNSLKPAEKESLKILQEIDIKNQEKAQLAAERRGEGFIPRINYVHIAVRPGINDASQDANENVIENVQSAATAGSRPSTQSKAAITRTGDINPIYFDAFKASARGSRFTNLDYYMTGGLMESNFAIKKLEKTLKENNPDGIPKPQQTILNALKKAQREVVGNVLENDLTENSFADEIVQFIQKQGYRTMLSSPIRWTTEVISNLQFAITHPKLFASGLSKANRLKDSSSLGIIMKNLGSTVITRVTGSGLNSSKIDTGLLNTRENAAEESRSKIGNKIMQVWKYTGKPWANGVSIIADTLISSPDKMMTTVFWKAEFANTFKKITGNNPDYSLIEANDEAYIRDNKEALDASTDAADRWTNTVGSTDNPFMKSLKGANPKGVLNNIIAQYNGFMLNFLKQEFISARQGTYELMGRGDRTRSQGAQLLAAVLLRMTAYTFIMKVLNDELFEALDIQDDDEEQKDPEYQLAQSIATTFTGLVLGRNSGNLTRTAQAFFIEQANKDLGEDITREGEYDPYRDNIQYDLIGGSQKNDKFLVQFFGSYTPVAKTGLLLLDKLTEEDKKTEDAIVRQRRIKYERLPIEVFGNLGMIPFYKDVKKILVKDIYKNMNAKQKTYTKEELIKLKRNNKSVYKNYIYKKKLEKYNKDLKKYNDYRNFKSNWKRKNPNKKIPKKPIRPRL